MADASDPNAQANGNPFASLASALMIPNTPNYVNPAYATPAQRAELYKYAAALMKPEPVRNWAQGLGEVARSIVAGYEGHQADVQEQASRAQATQDRANGPGQMIVPSSAAKTAPAAPPSSQGGMPADASSYAETDIPSITTRAAQKYGIDSSVATNVFAKESSLNPNAVGDNGTSFNVPQLHVTGDAKHPAMGDQFIAETGLDPRDPKNAPQAIDYALRRASKEGWGAWANTRDKLGYGNFTGIGRAPQGNAMPPNASSFTGSAQPQIPPAHQAMAAALIGGNPAAAPPASQNYKPMADALIGRQPQAAPMQIAQKGAMPVSPEAYARFMGNPNIPESEKTQFNAQVTPKQFQDVNGNVFYSYQNQPVQQQPIATLGHETNIEGVPGVRTGSVTTPQTNLALPNRGPNGETPNVLGPGSDVYNLQQQRAAAQAQADALKNKSAAAQQRFQKTQEAGPMLIAASYPLRQIQGLIEKNGGVIPSGQGAESVMGKESLVNMISSALGHPLTTEDSNLTTLELLKKYGVQVAGAQAQALNVHPTNLGLETAEQTSPGTSLSGPANMHLADNLVRLNDLAQRKNKFEHDFYLNHGQSPDSYDTFTQEWQKEISGVKAIPLSKYPVATKEYKGQQYDKLPSTDPSGFSWYPKGSVK